MEQCSFYEIAKSAVCGIGPMKIAMNQIESKILKDFILGVRIVQQLAQIAAHSIPIALEQLLPGTVRCLRRSMVRPIDERPRGRNQVEPMIGTFLVHESLADS